MNGTFEGERWITFSKVNGVFERERYVQSLLYVETWKINGLYKEERRVGRSVSFKVNGFEGGKYVRMFTICSMHVHKTKKITKWWKQINEFL